MTATPTRRPNMQPHECELCNCQQHRWNGYSCMLRTDPPSTCECGHMTSRHVFRDVAAR